MREPSPLRKLVVGIGEFAVTGSRDVVLASYSLGSCIGVSIFDPVAGVGGIAHIMLPSSRLAPDKAAARPGMFMDTALPALLRQAELIQAQRDRLVVCVAGGGRIVDPSGTFNIGQRNCEALREALESQALRVAASELGGPVNRTMYLQLDTGEVRIKISGHPGEIVLCKP